MALHHLPHANSGEAQPQKCCGGGAADHAVTTVRDPVCGTSVALAAADVGIAMGTGTDVAIESACVTLVKGDLNGIVRARRLSHATMRNIRQNLFLAFVYNAIGVPVAAGVGKRAVCRDRRLDRMFANGVGDIGTNDRGDFPVCQ